MYIIWEYDSFPYFLCGKIEEEILPGWFTVEGYGGMRFKAKSKIYDDHKGKLVVEMINRERKAKQIEQDNLDRRFNRIVEDSLSHILYSEENN